MTDKPELIAKHPETGKRHRWENIGFHEAHTGDFYTEPRFRTVSKWTTAHDSHYDLIILRDLGPVEENLDKALNDMNDIVIEQDKEAFDRDAEIERLKARVEELEHDNGVCETRLSQYREKEHQWDLSALRWGKKYREIKAALERSELDRQQAETQVAGLEDANKRLDDLIDQNRQQAEAKIKELETTVLRENRRALDAEAKAETLGERLNRTWKNWHTEAADLLATIRELESLSPAPLPVGVVRLPIYESMDRDGKYTETGTFSVLEVGWAKRGDYLLSPSVHCPLAVKAVLDFKEGNASDLRIILRRLDAPEEKTPEKPAPPKRSPFSFMCPCTLPEEKQQPTTSTPERIPLARDPSVSYWFVREEKPRPPRMGEYCLTWNGQAYRVRHDHASTGTTFEILHRVRIGSDWFDPNWNAEE